MASSDLVRSTSHLLSASMSCKPATRARGGRRLESNEHRRAAGRSAVVGLTLFGSGAVACVPSRTYSAPLAGVLPHDAARLRGPGTPHVRRGRSSPAQRRRGRARARRSQQCARESDGGPGGRRVAHTISRSALRAWLSSACSSWSCASCGRFKFSFPPTAGEADPACVGGAMVAQAVFGSTVNGVFELEAVQNTHELGGPTRMITVMLAVQAMTCFQDPLTTSSEEAQ